MANDFGRFFVGWFGHTHPADWACAACSICMCLARKKRGSDALSITGFRDRGKSGSPPNLRIRLGCREHHLTPAKFNNQIFSLFGQTRMGWRRFAHDSMRISFFWLMYLGLFSLPVLPFLFVKSPPDAKFLTTRSLVATAVIFVLVMAGVIWTGGLMPLCGNILDRGGIGPCSMYRAALAASARSIFGSP